MDGAPDVPVPEYAEEFIANGLVFRGVPEVFKLLGIFLEVEELAVGFIQEMDEFPFLAANHGLEVTFGVVFVTNLFGENVFATVEIIPFQDGLEGFGFEGFGVFDSGVFEDGGADVHELDLRFATGVGFDLSRSPYDERNPRNSVIHGPLLTVAVIGQAITMIGTEDDDGVIELAFGFEGRNDLANFVINHGDIGHVVLTLFEALFFGRFEKMDYGIVVEIGVMAPHAFIGLGLIFEIRLVNGLERQILVFVFGQMSRQGVVRWMRSGEANFEEEGFVLRVVFNPFDGPVANVVIGVRIRGKIPGEGTKAFFVVGAFAVLDAFLLFVSVSKQVLVPLIEVFSTFKETVFVLHDVAFMKSAWSLERPGVHLADVAAVVARFVKVFDPTTGPVVSVLKDAGGVGIVTGEETGPGWGTGGCRDVAVCEMATLLDEAVQVWGLHVRKPQAGNGVISLLIREEEYDVRTFGHVEERVI